jgi:long-chain acyl-CoA synthetase
MAVQRRGAPRSLAARTGCAIVEGYGLIGDLARRRPAIRPISTDFTGTIGLPLPSTDIAILDDEGRPVPLGERGEIAIRGPQVMAGYWQRPDETAKVMTEDGFFKSGDMGVMDERGYVRIVDRKKDMILVSGFNVYPNEVEDVVGQHAGRARVRRGRRRRTRSSGEAVKVFVVRKDPSD